MAGKSMHAFCYEGYGGGAAALKKVEIPVPTPKKGEILVKVEAASINSVDLKIQNGVMRPLYPKFPCVPLFDVTGEVVNIGAGVNDFQPGDKIVTLLDFKVGGLAEYTVAPTNRIAKRPHEVSAVEAASLPVAAATAFQALELVGATFDGTGKPFNVLITAASGGVGHFAVQLAKLAGLHVTATCGARNIDFVKSLGADEVLDYRTTEGESLKSPSGKKYDAVVHCTVGIAWSVFEKNLSKNGKVIDLTPGFSSFVTLALKKITFSKKQLVPYFANIGSKDLEFLVGLVKDGKLKPVIDSKHSFDKAPEAWAKSMEGHATGKIVIEI
ncbi:putative quinone-oxidoreductase [Carex littledalei]|uniref:Putative quinone-oxidoreductase n=1 Tax=Carex littledalei TaxID=544730 RepID=A0A833VI94_9POAL|nr:putative quinone-oxidoreductase [Carex littledalei]